MLTLKSRLIECVNFNVNMFRVLTLGKDVNFKVKIN